MGHMAKLRDHVRAILTELKRLHADPTFPRKQDGLPGLIHAGALGSLIVNREIEREITEVAAVLMQNDDSICRQFSTSEWRVLVRRAFGPALAAQIDSKDLSSSADKVLSDVRFAIEAARTEHGPMQYAVGCTLFGNTDIKPIVLGPVTIEPREVWLDRITRENYIDSVTARRLRRILQVGGTPRKRKGRIHQMRESEILQTIGNYPFVCSIATNQLPPERQGEGSHGRTHGAGRNCAGLE
jgi:hypothetical protein